MALLDIERNVVVIRVVYDGPPEAGKTTSLRALAGSLDRELFTPEERDGRTLFFDWMDYTAGRFEGYQIRCQVVSVPGQAELAGRRRTVLADADVVVVVADTSVTGIEGTFAYLRTLPPMLDALPKPRVATILQANKRDLPGALPTDALRDRLREEGWPVGLVESIASDGTGIRETFVFAVRLALDRVRELLRTDSLKRGRPTLDTGEALLDAIHALEAIERDTESPLGEAVRSACEGPAHEPPATDALASPVLAQVLDENLDATVLDADVEPGAFSRVESTAGATPAPPDPATPSGSIWPPVEGRLILHEAWSMGLRTQRLRSGDFVAGIGNGFRAHSSAAAVYEDVEGGRGALVHWARLHAATAPFTSSRRCIVLASTGDDRWRLWQIVRSEPSLRDYLEDLERRSADDVASRMLEAASVLAELHARARDAGYALPCTLDNVGRVDGRAVYVGLMPVSPPSVPASSSSDLLRAELRPLFHNTLFERRGEVLSALDRARRRSLAARGFEPIGATLSELLSS